MIAKNIVAIRGDIYVLHRHLLDYYAEIKKSMCLRTKHEQVNWGIREANAEDTYQDLIRHTQELDRLLGNCCSGGEGNV